MSEPTITTPVTVPDPAAVKEEMLKIYPAKTAKKRAKQIILNEPEAPPEIGGQLAHHSRHHHPARLHLRRLPRCRVGTDLRHSSNHTWTGRLRILRLALAPQFGARASRLDQLSAILPEHRHAGGPDYFRRRKEIEAGHSRGLRHFQAQGHCYSGDLPGRPHRR